MARPNRARLAALPSLRTEAVGAYDSLAIAEPQFAYRVRSVKASLFSYPGLYIGFAGYYNPFTGEAQVNMLDPDFRLPYTTCHEMGHQLGYAKENEANFIGFLACRGVRLIRRSGIRLISDLYGYAIQELYFRDSVLAMVVKGKLRSGCAAGSAGIAAVQPAICESAGAGDLEGLYGSICGRTGSRKGSSPIPR